ncbi:MAG TPA: RagB/SusD family nutrient uptake outer membrane protein [Longimicrobium sp.]|nr:RagB/SusD family nutrient uptake outer membrane protein [Longimicrobium sp.]
MSRLTRRRAVLRPGVAAGTALVALLGLGACDALDDLLSVDKPATVPAEVIDDPLKAQLMVNGAIADFECALGAYVVMAGIIGEEFIDATQTADRWPYDRREVQPGDARYATSNCQNIGVYTPLSTARYSADQALQRLTTWTDDQLPGMNRQRLIATAAAYAGYSYLLLGEGFCSAAVDGGPELTPQQMFALAEERFTQAIAAAAAASAVPGQTAAQLAEDQSLRNMALVGRARARLNQSTATPAKLALAGQDAALVPSTFSRLSGASAGDERRYNRVFAQNNQGNLVAVGTRYRGLTVNGVADPRVVATDAGRNATDGTRIWVQGKYSALTSGIPIATYDEAQLILAEVQLRSGQPGTAVNTINALRARAGVGAYGGGTSADEVMALLIEERRRELFLEGHHLYDAIRFNLALQPATGTAFPKGGLYGSTKCLPLPNVERFNNPNIG